MAGLELRTSALGVELRDVLNLLIILFVAKTEVEVCIYQNPPPIAGHDIMSILNWFEFRVSFLLDWLPH